MTLKKLAEDKTQTAIDIKKVTDYAMNPLHIEIEPGFNARDMVHMTLRTRAHVDSIKHAIRAGVTLPPLDVKHVGERVFVREGHCRLTAMHELIAEGFEIPFTAVRDFRGNDADQLAHVLDTDEKGLSLTRLEHGRQLVKMRRLGWTIKALADRFRKSEAYISQNLTLADANSDVHALLDAETVPVKVALDAIRAYGEEAGAKLAEALSKSGKPKLTQSAISGRAVPRKVVSRVRTSLQELFDAESGDLYRARIAEADDDALISVPAARLKALMAALDAMEALAPPPTDEPGYE